MGLFGKNEPHVVKSSGKSAWSQRGLTSHGSKAEKGLLKSHGKLARWAEKPTGTFAPGRRRPGSW